MESDVAKSFFTNIELCAKNPSLALFKAFDDDIDSRKVNLAVGAYRTDRNEPYVLPAVKRAEVKVVNNSHFNNEYLPTGGWKAFTNAAVEFLLGIDSPAIREQRVQGYQTISGSGALRLGADLLAKALGLTTVFISNPTWENHSSIFSRAGFKDVRTYRYWEPKTRSFDVNGMLEDLKNAVAGSIIILQACAHNPTGCDPNVNEWIRIADTIEQRNLLVFFDAAYQGFGSGDINKDAFAVRLFVSRGLEFLCAQSFSKNFGLYGHRVGNLTIVHRQPLTIPLAIEQLDNLVSDSYLNPPGHGARIVQSILQDSELYEEWQRNLRTMTNRLKYIRGKLYDELVRLKTPGSWKHIIQQSGMFSYTGLTEVQVKFIINEHHVFMRKTGRISLCGLNEKNVGYVAKAIHETVTAIPN